MAELVKDERKITRNGDKITFCVMQEQIMARKTIVKNVDLWKEALQKTKDKLENFDKEKQEQIEIVKKTFEANKQKFEQLLKMSEQEHIEKLKEIREQDLQNAKAFVDNYPKLKTQEVIRLAEMYKNIEAKLKDNKKELEDTLKLWDKEEYLKD